MENKTQSHINDRSLAIPTFDVDKSTSFMLHNSKDLTPIQTHLLSQINILNQKSDWTMNTLVGIQDDLTKQVNRINYINDWKEGVDTWKGETDKKIKGMTSIVDEIRDSKEKAKFLKGCFDYVLSGLVSAASALGALWFIIDKLNFIK